jgi:hypothetical protein
VSVAAALPDSHLQSIDDAVLQQGEGERGVLGQGADRLLW